MKFFAFIPILVNLVILTWPSTAFPGDQLDSSSITEPDRAQRPAKYSILSDIHGGSNNQDPTTTPEGLTTTEPEDENKFQCLQKKLEVQGSKICFNETLEILGSQNSLDLFYEAAATRGDPSNNFRLSLVDIHMFMRQNYATLIEAVGKNIFPLMVATDSEPDYSGTGGVWKVYFRNGTMQRIVPVGTNFEIFKCLSHMVLGIFTVIGPYFNSPNSISWKPKLADMDQKIQSALFVLNDSGLPTADQLQVRVMLELASKFINNCLKKNQASRQDYEAFSKEFAPLIEMSMKKATEAHVAATIPALKLLKEQMGEKEWKKMFVIIPTVWPVALYNLRVQMLQQVMDFKQMSEQVLIAEGAKNEDDAKTTLGRIVNDRALAQMVFGSDPKNENLRDHIFALSTKRDLVSTSEEKAINKYCKGQLQPIPSNGDTHPPQCPLSRHYATMLKQGA